MAATPPMATKPLPRLQFPYCAKRYVDIPPPEAYTSPIVKVVVGTGVSPKTFHIYKGLLTHYSDYFRLALGDRWKEGQDNTVHLPDEDVRVFESFNYWLFANRLYRKPECADHTDTKSVEEVPLSCKEILEIYFFADKRGIAGLANMALDVLFAKTCQMWVLPTYMFHYIYDNTPPGSKLRDYIIDDTLATFFFVDLRSMSHEWPQELLVDLIATAEEKNINMLGDKQPQEIYTREAKRTFCAKYHDHSTLTKTGKKVFS